MIEILTLESLDKIEGHLKRNPDDIQIINDFDTLFDTLQLTTVQVDYDIYCPIEGLQIPDGSTTSNLLTDQKNIKIVYEHLENLSPAEATDERLWATITLRFHPDYVKLRWPLPNISQTSDKENKVSVHIIKHWLCSDNVRSRTRDNAISRLWWMGYLVSQLDGWSIEDSAPILFNNSDYRQNLLERTTSTSAPNVLAAILAITKEAFIADVKFDRACFRAFMKKVNFLAGRTNLAALNEIQTISLLKPYYYEAYKKKNLEKGNVFTRLLRS